MRRPERRIDQAAAIAEQAHRQLVQAEIDRDLLVAAPRDEGRDRVDVGQKPSIARPAAMPITFASVTPSMNQRSGISGACRRAGRG
jgi:hypothetical protein